MHRMQLPLGLVASQSPLPSGQSDPHHSLKWLPFPPTAEDASSASARRPTRPGAWGRSSVIGRSGEVVDRTVGGAVGPTPRRLPISTAGSWQRRRRCAAGPYADTED